MQAGRNHNVDRIHLVKEALIGLEIRGIETRGALTAPRFLDVDHADELGLGKFRIDPGVVEPHAADADDPDSYRFHDQASLPQTTPARNDAFRQSERRV